MRSKFKALSLAGVIWLVGCSNDVLDEARDQAVASYDEPANSLRQVDRARGRIWELGIDGVTVREPGRGRTMTVALPDWIVVRAEEGCLPALALGPGGEAVVTSNVIPTLWRIDPETAAVSVHPLALDTDNDMDVGFSRLWFSPAHGAYFGVSNVRGSIWKINTALTSAEKVGTAGQSTEQTTRSQSCDIS